jgi:hypothetical protein
MTRRHDHRAVIDRELDKHRIPHPISHIGLRVSIHNRARVNHHSGLSACLIESSSDHKVEPESSIDQRRSKETHFQD